MKSKNNEVIFISVLGISPAVLTETLWALAHEKTPVLPDKIVVLTTTAGRSQLVDDLFETPQSIRPCGWDRFINALKKENIFIDGKLKFGQAQEHVRIFPAACGTHDSSDIASSHDNEIAADFILQTLRAFTERNDTVVLASLAGGRKTMSALLMACMSLLGRANDRLFHILVNPPYDSPLSPVFLFPTDYDTYYSPNNLKVTAAPILSLIEVPFVRMRGWYADKFRTVPPSYAALVHAVQETVPSPKNYPTIHIDGRCASLTINKQDVSLSAFEFACISAYLAGVPFHDICTEIQKFQLSSTCARWIIVLHESSRFKKSSSQDVSKALSQVREKTARLFKDHSYTHILFPTGGKPTRYPPNKIKCKNLPFN